MPTPVNQFTFRATTEDVETFNRLVERFQAESPLGVRIRATDILRVVFHNGLTPTFDQLEARSRFGAATPPPTLTRAAEQAMWSALSPTQSPHVEAAVCCGDDSNSGLRCDLAKGHDGMHEAADTDVLGGRASW